MKKKRIFLLFYALIPFLASLPGFGVNLLGLTRLSAVLVPLVTALLCFAFRKKTDAARAAGVCGGILLFLLLSFTLMMLLSGGSAEGRLVTGFCWLIFPFAPVMLADMLMGQSMLLYLTAFLSYAAAFGVFACLSRMKPKKLLAPAALVLLCTAVCASLYARRPAVKYAGHGFDFMHGYSSTDFTDYTVYSPASKLAVPDAPVTLCIERAEDMPVLDGAEACYPLYAAFARAVYRDIDRIEADWLRQSDDQRTNGRIVTFTNTVTGFSRLLRGTEDPDKYLGGADMFFGARPSPSQLWEAEESGVELEITPIGREAFVFFVEADNPVEELSSEELKAVYHGDVTNWRELGGKEQEITAFQRPRNSGSQTMMEYFMGDVTLKEPKTYEKVDAMMGVITQVAQYANESGAMGYSFRYFLEELNQETGVKMLSVDGVYPSLENIENGSYPLVADVCLITRKGDPNPFVAQMRDFILSEAGQEIVRKTGYAGVAE